MIEYDKTEKPIKDHWYVGAFRKQSTRIVRSRCNWCRCFLEINRGSISTASKLYNYCSEWCWEMEHLPDISHTCLNCGVVVQPYLSRQGYSSGIYRKYCPDCKKGRGKPRKDKKDLRKITNCDIIDI